MMRLRDETIGGFTAGVAGTVLGYPLDLVKTRMQTATLSPGKNSSNLFVVMRGIIRRGKQPDPVDISAPPISFTYFT